ncbi:MAG: iron-sulfur cluster repair di-iron protein [Pseudomonadota bacterium]
MNLSDMAVAKIALDISGATALFKRHGIDYCCCGDRSLSRAALASGADLDDLLAELDTLRIRQQVDGVPRRWENRSPGELVDYLVSRFHNRHREQLPELVDMAASVESAHRHHSDCPAGLESRLRALQADLSEHMEQEEKTLFPMLLGELGVASRRPLGRMAHEHERHGEAIHELETMCHGLVCPADACATWQLLYRGLAEFCEDLREHIALENNVLFRDYTQ